MVKNTSIFVGAFLLILIMAGFSPAMDRTKGKLYVVGMGPAGPDLTAPRALAIVEKADVLLCSPRMPQRFAAFGRTIDPSKIAFDPWKGVFDKKSQHLKRSDPKAWRKQMDKHQTIPPTKIGHFLGFFQCQNLPMLIISVG